MFGCLSSKNKFDAEFSVIFLTISDFILKQYNYDSNPFLSTLLFVHIAGVAGGSASGKTAVCDMIIQQLHDQRVVLVNQVMSCFYTHLSLINMKVYIDCFILDSKEIKGKQLTISCNALSSTIQAFLFLPLSEFHLFFFCFAMKLEVSTECFISFLLYYI